MIIENIINNKWFQFLLYMQCFIPIITNLAIFLSLSTLSRSPPPGGLWSLAYSSDRYCSQSNSASSSPSFNL